MVNMDVTFIPTRHYIEMEAVMSATLKTTDASFKQDVLDSKVPVLVDFWA